jgi:hypothetical protein
MSNNADKIAKLEAEVAALKAAQPKPQKSWEEMERENREWISQMHELREGRMAYAVHPSVVRDMAGGVTEADCADLRRASHAPTGPSAQGVIPSSQTLSNVRGTGGAKTGDWGAADVVYHQPANVSRGTDQRTWEERMRFASDEDPEKKP